MTKLNTYSSKGVKTASTSLPKNMKEKENLPLLAQAIRVYENRSHAGLSKTKTRSEITASKRKIYRQKGTGRARHGARSAPIFVGGSKAHGAKGLKRVLKFSSKMRKKALDVALSIKVKDGQIVAINGLSKIKKTKEAAGLLDKITKKEESFSKRQRFTFCLSEKNKDIYLYLRNLKDVQVLPFRNLNAYNVYFGGVLILDKEAFNEKSIKGTKSTTSITSKVRKSHAKKVIRRQPKVLK